MLFLQLDKRDCEVQVIGPDGDKLLLTFLPCAKGVIHMVSSITDRYKSPTMSLRQFDEVIIEHVSGKSFKVVVKNTYPKWDFRVKMGFDDQRRDFHFYRSKLLKGVGK